MITGRKWFPTMALAASVALLGPAAIARADKPHDHGNKGKEHAAHGRSEEAHANAPGQIRKAEREQEVEQQRQAQWQQRQIEQRRMQQRQMDQQRQIDQRQMNEQRQMRRARLSAARQQQLINQQRQRRAQYAMSLQRQAELARQRAATLERQRRINQYRVQQQYLRRLQEQQLALRNAYDYNSDPYFYTAPVYRYSRAGSTYEINQYAADELRRAANLGYDEGYRVGQADRADNWQSDYRNSWAYQDANYGYTGRYVSQSDYNYYFREGMRRGYEDGYYSRNQYGQQQSNGLMTLVAAVLQQILGLQPMY